MQKSINYKSRLENLPIYCKDHLQWSSTKVLILINSYSYADADRFTDFNGRVITKQGLY